MLGNVSMVVDYDSATNYTELACNVVDVKHLGAEARSQIKNSK